MHEGLESSQFADPFCGSAVVSWFLANNTNCPVISGDLQSYATARASAVVMRTEKLDATPIIKNWFVRAQRQIDRVLEFFPNHLRSVQTDNLDHIEIKKQIRRCRKFADEVLPGVLIKVGGNWPVSKAYGGYYYSPEQALILDALRATLPRNIAEKNAALAALIEAASKCAASPGHTAQPFQPTEGASAYIVEAWRRNIFDCVRKSLVEICRTHANRIGQAYVGDFSRTISGLSDGDLVFADPPYSGVHYSRFYHVLETITRGKEITPEGIGRYPSFDERPASDFSRRKYREIQGHFPYFANFAYSRK